MSGTVSGHQWLEDLKIKATDLEFYPARERVYLRDIWEHHFASRWQEFPDGVPARIFYSKLEELREQKFYSSAVERILGRTGHPREFAREIQVYRMEQCDRREYLKMGAFGLLTFLAAKYLTPLIPRHLPSQAAEPSVEEVKRREEVQLTSLYAGFLGAQPYKTRVALVDTVDRLAGYTDSLERRISSPDVVKDKKECFRTADLLCSYKEAVGNELDSLMKMLNIRQTRNGCIVSYKNPSNLFVVAGVAVRLQKLTPSAVSRLQSLVQEYASNVRVVRKEYEEVKDLLLKEHISYEEVKKFGKVGNGMWNLAKQHEAFRKDLETVLRVPSTMLAAEK